VAYIKTYVDSSDTTFIGTADHETGGLTLGGIVETGEYQYVNWRSRHFLQIHNLYVLDITLNLYRMATIVRHISPPSGLNTMGVTQKGTS
jgi:alkaline phosphatase